MTELSMEQIVSQARKNLSLEGMKSGAGWSQEYNRRLEQEIMALTNQRSGWVDVVKSKMVEAGKDRFFVRLIHPNRPKDAMPWDEGYMDVFSTFTEEHADEEVQRWKKFIRFLTPPKEGE